MRFEIEELQDGLRVEFEEVGADREALLRAVSMCEQGCCNCPSYEYRKLQAFDVESDGERVEIRMSAKAGSHFDSDQIQRCMAYFASHCREGDGEGGLADFDPFAIK
jgi:hypothetical protein